MSARKSGTIVAFGRLKKDCKLTKTHDFYCLCRDTGSGVLWDTHEASLMDFGGHRDLVEHSCGDEGSLLRWSSSQEVKKQCKICDAFSDLWVFYFVNEL